MRFKELLRPAEQVSPFATIKDRRRPGRKEQVSSHLIPLLRNPGRMDIRAPVPDKLEMPLAGNDLVHLKGISLSLAVSLALGVLFWAWMAGMLRAVLR